MKHNQNLINGQKPEFGNPEHIRLMKEAERKATEVAAGIITPNARISYEALDLGDDEDEDSGDYDGEGINVLYFDFLCSNCQHHIKGYFEEEDNGFEEQDERCARCDARYVYRNKKFYRQPPAA